MSLHIMIEVSELLNKFLLIIVDFDLYHTNRDNCTVNSTAQAKKFADRIANKNDKYELEVGTIIHARGGALNLVIVSNLASQEVTECYVKPNLHVTSHHEPILTYLEMKNSERKKTTQCRFWLDKMEEKWFLSN